jgi:SNF2-related domain/Helicase conserved C-terminal domain
MSVPAGTLLGMKIELAAIDPDVIEDIIGTDSYDAALEYVRRHAVGRQMWVGAHHALFGIVLGSHGDYYTSAIFFSPGPPLEVLRVHCDCAARHGCAHAAALLISALEGGVEAAASLPAIPRQTRRSPTWDASLEAWLPAGPQARRRPETTLAIELTLMSENGRPVTAPASPRLRLVGRLVQPGKHGSWIASSLNWAKLDSYGYHPTHSAEQLQLLRELLGLHRARADRSFYYSSYGGDRSIELSAVDSSRLWPLLDEAEKAGLQLVYGRKLGALERYREAELCLDVTRPEAGGPFAVTPAIRVDAPGGEATVVPLRFIGTGGHGVVYLDRDEAQRSEDPAGWRFRLARLRRGVPARLQELTLGGQRLEVPADGETRFRDEFYPRLQQTAAVISSDGSFTPPAISDPTLVLRAAYSDGHEVLLDWEWAYQVGESHFRAGLHEPRGDAGYRDLAAEQALLDRLRLGGIPEDMVASARLGGLETVRFTTELLPLLTGQPGVSVEVTGDVADYREVSDSLCIGVSTAEITDEVDWFDLGVTILAEGRAIPFADVFADMGLGKTLETLALICHAREADPGGGPFLVVTPTSVVPNWAAEAARFAPGLKVVTITGTRARSGADLAGVVAGADIVVTSYTLLRLDFDAYAAAGWSGLILDEAQYVKNHQSKIYQCARRLPAPFKVAITGTPMENNVMELWSLLSITAPGLFPDPSRFREYYARPIERQGDAGLLTQLRRRIKPLVKRRTKEQVAADLPDKQEQVLEVDLHPRHRKLYQTHLQRERQKVLKLIDDMDANRFTILSSLTRLRRLSLHAALIDSAYEDVPCSKIDTLVDQIQDVAAGGHRALVFSQFTGFLGRVRDRLDAAGVGHCYLDGQTGDRAEVLSRFKRGTDPVFLISLKAGGSGLNLTEADYCFLLDPWWNPATEAQAVDRTHRIGQTRNVMVYRLIARDTIEQKVMALQARKAELFASVIDAGNVFGGGLDADDIRGLLV